jgi:hypothetical protein
VGDIIGATKLDEEILAEMKREEAVGVTREVVGTEDGGVNDAASALPGENVLAEGGESTSQTEETPASEVISMQTIAITDEVDNPADKDGEVTDEVGDDSGEVARPADPSDITQWMGSEEEAAE